jgi:uncharacterized SAM-binding protein YcdF (DUF218 family)
MTNRALFRRSLAALIGLVLIADGVWLMLQDKINFGTVLPTMIGAGLFLWSWQHSRLQACLLSSHSLRAAWGVFVLGFWIWVLSLAMFFVNIAKLSDSSALTEPSPLPNAIVVLGSGLLNNEPTPTLQARLNIAVKATQSYSASIPILAAGGLGRHQVITEAQAMANYLMTHGVSPPRIILENRSTSTYENLLFAKPLLPVNAQVLLVTSDFHMQRSLAIARKVGVQVVRHASAPTPLQIRFNAWLREYFAFISGWLLNEY